MKLITTVVCLLAVAWVIALILYTISPTRPQGLHEPQTLEQSLVRRLTPAEFLSLSEAGRDYVRQYGREL